jgi:hypothetical protein
VSISSGSASIVPALEIGSSPPSPRSLTPASSLHRESVTSLVIFSDHHAPKALYYDSSSLSKSRLQQPGSSPSTSSMVFSQESSYPVLPSNITRRDRTASQTARAISSASPTDADVMLPSPPPPSSSSCEKEKGCRAKIHPQIQSRGKLYKSIANRTACGLEKSIT